jgi:hypothetical protein
MSNTFVRSWGSPSPSKAAAQFSLVGPAKHHPWVSMSEFAFVSDYP